MSRIPYADASRISPAVRDVVARSPLNVMRMLAGASEGMFFGFAQFASSVYAGTTLDPVLREIALLRVGYIANAGYETWHHEQAARAMDMSEAQIAAVRQGGRQPGVLDDQQQAVLDFSDEVVKNARASDETLAAVRGFLSDTHVIDLILMIGCYMTISRLLETAGVELDEIGVEWSSLNKKNAPPVG